MEIQTVYIGEIVVSKNGYTYDDRRQVEFTAEVLGSASAPDHDGNRGTEWTLFKLEDGQLVVHTRHWSRWQGEPDEMSLEKVAEAELRADGRYWRLGEACGYGRPLTLEEALRVQETGSMDVDDAWQVAMEPEEHDEDAAEWQQERE